MRRLSESEKFVIWDRFEAGESLRSISRRLGRPPSTIRTHCRVLRAGTQRGSVAVGDGHASDSGRLRLWNSRTTC